MRTFTPQRRTAAICGGCAAIIPSSTLFMQNHPSSPSAQFTGRMMIGVALTISLATLIKYRYRTRT